MSIRITSLRLNTRGLACGNFNLAGSTFTKMVLTSPLFPSSPYLSVVGSREFETATYLIHPLQIWLVQATPLPRLRLGPWLCEV